MDAFAISPEEVAGRLAAVESFRSARIARGIPTIDDAEVQKAIRGTTVTGLQSSSSGPAKVYGMAILHTSLAALWAALHDETRQMQYTAIAYSEVISGRPCEPGRRILQVLPIPFLAARWWIGVPKANAKLIRDSGGSVREFTWSSSTDAKEVTSTSGQKMIAGGTPIGSTSGAWFLVALDERNTWAEYFALSDPGAGVPAGIASRLAAKGVRDNFDAIVQFANEGKPSCPIQ